MRFQFLPKPKTFVAPLMALAMGIAACGQQAEPPAPTAGGDTPAGAPAGEGVSAELSGAGASFPAPLYQRWFTEYSQKVNPNVKVSYQSVGSGAGIEQYINGTVAFGATDAPITAQEERLEAFRKKYNEEPIQVPTVGGAVAMAYNLPAIEGQELRLSREAFCGIVEGRIKQWNDPLIAKENPDLKLPDNPITFARRSDGSGTTFIFTNHVDTACPGWQAGVGTSVNWPAGIGAQGNEGVAAQIQQNEGTIGYVEYAYAELNDIPMALLQNAAGEFVAPTPESAGAAFEDVEIPEDFALLVPDPKNAKAYPIAGLTWLLIYPEYQEKERLEALRNVITWSLNEGRSIATELGYVPLPESVVDRVEEVLQNEVTAASAT